MAKEGLRKWFSRNQGKGWVDCKTGKPCGRRKGEKRKSYPACRPTMAQCTSAMKKKTSSKRISWKQEYIMPKDKKSKRCGIGKISDGKGGCRKMTAKEKRYLKESAIAHGVGGAHVGGIAGSQSGKSKSKV